MRRPRVATRLQAPARAPEPIEAVEEASPMSHEGYHEPFEHLPEPVRAMHRAIVSLMEELEAVDWYYQRAAVDADEALKAVLLHNAHEEIEHAMMVLEWIRRRDSTF